MPITIKLPRKFIISVRDKETHVEVWSSNIGLDEMRNAIQTMWPNMRMKGEKEYRIILKSKLTKTSKETLQDYLECLFRGR